MTFNEIDVVVTRVPLSRDGETFPAGTIGTVVCVFSQPYEAYEVEFIDDQGETLGFVTALPDQIALDDIRSKALVVLEEVALTLRDAAAEIEPSSDFNKEGL